MREREHQTAMEAKQKMNVLREQNPNFGRGIYMGVCALGCCTLRLVCCFGDINFGLYKGNFEILVYPVDAGTAIGLYKPMSFCSHLKKS